MSPRVPFDSKRMNQRINDLEAEHAARLDSLQQDIYYLGIFAGVSLALIAGTMFVLYLLLGAK